VVAVVFPNFDAMPNTPTFVDVELTTFNVKVLPECVTEKVFL